MSGRIRLQLTEAEIELLLELLETAAGGRVRPWSIERILQRWPAYGPS